MERTTYMQSLMTSTYPMVAIEAINGGFSGAWERLIAKQILKDYEADHSEATEIMCYAFAAGIKSKAHAAVRSAYLITSSKIKSNEPATN